MQLYVLETDKWVQVIFEVISDILRPFETR